MSTLNEADNETHCSPGCAAWAKVAVDSNKAVDALVREQVPNIGEHYGMPEDGVRKAIKYAYERGKQEGMDLGISYSLAHHATKAYADGLALSADRRHSTLLKPRVYPDGDRWCALYGDDLTEGVCGFGDSPELAALAFDEAWCKMIKVE